jgi:hypothetical protein
LVTERKRRPSHLDVTAVTPYVVAHNKRAANLRRSDGRARSKTARRRFA